jgi:hypothetical protein
MNLSNGTIYFPSIAFCPIIIYSVGGWIQVELAQSSHSSPLVYGEPLWKRTAI